MTQGNSPQWEPVAQWVDMEAAQASGNGSEAVENQPEDVDEDRYCADTTRIMIRMTGIRKSSQVRLGAREIERVNVIKQDEEDESGSFRNDAQQVVCPAGLQEGHEGIRGDLDVDVDVQEDQDGIVVFVDKRQVPVGNFVDHPKGDNISR